MTESDNHQKTGPRAGVRCKAIPRMLTLCALVVASFATMIVCAAAAEDVKWRESLIVAVGVTAFCSVLFPYGLNLPFQLWPRFW